MLTHRASPAMTGRWMGSVLTHTGCCDAGASCFAGNDKPLDGQRINTHGRLRVDHKNRALFTLVPGYRQAASLGQQIVSPPAPVSSDREQAARNMVPAASLPRPLSGLGAGEEAKRDRPKQAVPYHDRIADRTDQKPSIFSGAYSTSGMYMSIR